MLCRLIFLVTLLGISRTLTAEDWRPVYSENFDTLTTGTKTATPELANWEAFSAAGVVVDGGSDAAGKFLVAAHSWRSFNQGPILNLDLSTVPHDRVRLRLDLYTFGDWRGLQKSAGGPQHRLMFFDNKAQPPFAFDTNFSTNPKFHQSWPQPNPASHEALRGAVPVEVDTSGRLSPAHRWSLDFAYPSDSNQLRFTILCGAAAGGGTAMPPFGIDNIRVSVRSTLPTIQPLDRPLDRRRAQKTPPRAHATSFAFNLSRAERLSLGIFNPRTGQLVRTLRRREPLAAGRHALSWDGLDNRGRPVKPGEYEWRTLAADGFTAKYVTTIGINPPGGEHPVPRRSWIGDHVGGGIVDVDESGVYVGSPLTEGLMMLAKVDAKTETVSWTREQFYQSGRLTRAATSGRHVFMLHPNGKVRRLNKQTGVVEAEWQISPAEEAPGDIDAQGQNLVVVDGALNQVRWLSIETGGDLASVPLTNPACLAVLDGFPQGRAVVAAGSDLYVVQPGTVSQHVSTLSGTIGALDYDPIRLELWAVVNGHQVVRLDQTFHVTQIYSDAPRELGPFDPTRFAGVYDLAADLEGGFFIGEPGHPPRRIAHIARDGSLLDQWFGGMSFYVNATFDPADPTRLYGIAPEGFVNVYQVDYPSGTWELAASYATGRLGDGMFPNAGSFRAVRRGEQTYLYHRVVPAVVRLDPQLRQAVPVAIAGRVLKQGRSFFQYAGSGRDGYPRPWVAAAEHHGYQELAQAPGLYSWADSDDDGEFDPEEFRFYPQATRGLSFHNPGDFAANGDYLGSTNVNEPQAIIRLPVSHWEGPEKNAPRWDWNATETAGDITADSYGYGSPRSVRVGPHGTVTVAYQAGIMIRDHGQYEGGGWPEAALRGARVLGFNAELHPLFAVGRQSKTAAEANRGVLYYPMQTARGPHRSVIVNDQTKQAAQVWSHDGLYLGSLFDARADDGRDDGFYQVHGDDNQGVTLVTAADGRTYWLMPYQGHNRLYEINGWAGWRRQSGRLTLKPTERPTATPGTGLTARYYQGHTLLLETKETPIYYERFADDRHTQTVTAPFHVVWSGRVTPPLSDRYQFTAFLGKNEQVAVWIDGQVVYAAGFGTDQNALFPVALTAGHRHQMRIEYINPAGRAELNLLWSSRVADPTRLPLAGLFPDNSQ